MPQEQLSAYRHRAVFRGLDRLGFHVEPSAVTKGWPLIDSPTPLLLCMVLYFAVVGVGLATVKPKAKGQQDPAWVKLLVNCHNVFLIVLSTYMCLGAIYEVLSRARAPGKSPPPPPPRPAPRG